jgi:predicted MFS family arabinose efflux permease
MRRAGVLVVGIAFLIAANLILALGASISAVMFGVGLWGLHMGFTQGLLATIVAYTAPADLRGTAFGVFNFATGIAMPTAGGF